MSFLFNGLFWAGSGVVTLIVVLAIVCIKFPNSRFLICGIAGVLFFGFSAYCISDIAYYYTAEGGTYGTLSGLFDVNIVEESEDELSFSLKNIELKQIDGDKYGASIKFDKTPTIDAELEYYIFVNGIPTTSAEVATTYAKASNKFVFYDDNMDIFLEDTIEISFAFYTNFSTLEITTNGGADAVKEWQAYFQRENFVITIEQSILGSIV